MTDVDISIRGLNAGALAADTAFPAQNANSATDAEKFSWAEMGGLIQTAATITTANVTPAAGSFTLATIAGLTDDRDFILPDSTSVGEKVALFIVDGDDTYSINIKSAAAGSLINGSDASSDPFRSIQTINEFYIFECVKSGGAGDTDWLCTHNSIDRDILADGLKLDNIEKLATADQTAAEVPNTPAGSIVATDVQAAINELDAEKAKLAGDSVQDFSTKTLTINENLNIPNLPTTRPSAVGQAWVNDNAVEVTKAAVTRKFVTLNGVDEFGSITAIRLAGDFDVERKFSLSNATSTRVLFGRSVINTSEIYAAINTSGYLHIKITSSTSTTLVDYTGTTNYADGALHTLKLSHESSELTLRLDSFVLAVGTLAMEPLYIDRLGCHGEGVDSFKGTIADFTVEDIYSGVLYRYKENDGDGILRNTGDALGRYRTELKSALSQYYAIPEVALSGDFRLEVEEATLGGATSALLGADSDADFFLITSSDNLQLRLSGSPIITSPATVATDGELRIYSVTLTGNDFEFFDGEVSLGVVTDAVAAANSLVFKFIGNANSGNYPNGTISNVKIWDNGTLVGYYKIDEDWVDDTVLVNSAATLGSEENIDVTEPANGGTYTDNGDGTFTVTGTGSNFSGARDNEYTTAIGRSYVLSVERISGGDAFVSAVDTSYLVIEGSTNRIAFTATEVNTRLYISPGDSGSVTYTNLVLKQADGYGNAINITSADATRDTIGNGNWNNTTAASWELLTQQRNGNWLGNEKVINPIFDTDTVWSKGTGWTIGNGEATHTTPNPGTLLTQAGIVDIDLTYRTIYDAGNVSGSLALQLGSAGIERETTGTFTEVITATSIDLTFKADAVIDFAGTIDNVSVRRILQVPISVNLVNSDIGDTVQAYDIDTTKNDKANTFTQDQKVPNLVADAIQLTDSVGITFDCMTLDVNDDMQIGDDTKVNKAFIKTADDQVYKRAGVEKHRVTSTGTKTTGDHEVTGQIIFASGNITVEYEGDDIVFKNAGVVKHTFSMI